MSYCSACHRLIVWVKTSTGKNMPCDASLIPFWVNGEKSKRIVTKFGNVISCEYEGSGDPAGLGYVPHWATCPNADKMRKKK